MKEHFFSRLVARCVHVSSACVIVAVCCASAWAQTSAPVLLSEGTGTTTRAVAFESVTHAPEPFTVNSNIAWNPDTRTRVMLFAMNVQLFAGEAANALTADAEDGTGRRYALKVEHVDQVPAQPWIYSIILRLSDDMADTTGDVLVRINIHGMASNRVRVAIGRTGGGPPTDVANEVLAPAPPTPPAPTPTPVANQYALGAAASDADTTRFLEQASWGPNRSEIDRVKAMGLRAYLNEQFSAPPQFSDTQSDYPALTLMPTDQATGCPTSVASDPTYIQSVCLRMNYQAYPLQRQFYTNALYQPDQLRQRVAFALHKIMVVSERDIVQPSWVTPYLQSFDHNAFGNFRTLLQEITLNPGMGQYLDMRGNLKTNPNENYAREILQLFSVGLDKLNADGTPILDAQGNRVPTYDQATITNFARVFTGWNLAPNKTITLYGNPTNVLNYIDPMTARDANHDVAQKVLLDGATLAANPNPGSSASDLNAALDNIFNHPNVGPFIGKQLIQQLVTSNPSPAYVQRVASVFNNNGFGVRGDLKAVVTAILLDPEARGDLKTDPNFGRLREPAQLVNNLARAFNARSFDKSTNSDGMLNDQSLLMDQDVFRPPTVFSYFPSDYGIPGTNLKGPEFGILSTTTSLRRNNFVNTLVVSGITANGSTNTRPNGTSLDLSAMQALASDPQALVNALDALMMHGTMSTSMRNSIVQAITPTTDLTRRTQMAIYLVASSSQYQVQR